MKTVAICLLLYLSLTKNYNKEKRLKLYWFHLRTTSFDI